MKRHSAHTGLREKRIGALAPRYLLALNPFSDARFTVCPICRSLTRLRKLPLAIHVDAFGMIILRKTCRLCTICEMLIVHLDELEPLVASQLSALGHSIDRPDYLVLGTVDPRVWRRGLTARISIDEVVHHMADFRKHLQIEQTGHGWKPPK